MKKPNEMMSKMMSSMFTEVSNVSYDLASGQVGIKTDAGLLTLGKDGIIDQNPMDFFSMEVPAFALNTPIKDIKRGDILVSSGKAYAFVLENGMTENTNKNATSADNMVERSSIEAMNFMGHITRFRPKKVNIMGNTGGVMVVKSLFNMMGANEQDGSFNMQSMLPLMMMMKSGDGKGDMKDMLLPLMLMGGQQGGGLGGMNPMMLMLMMGGENSLFK